MSYDLNFYADDGEGRAIYDTMSPTYNLSPMFEMALGFPLRQLEGKEPSECLPHFVRALTYLREHPDECRAMEPANRWGSYRGAVETFEKLVEWATALTSTVRFRV